jgi:hypothetical protein
MAKFNSKNVHPKTIKEGDILYIPSELRSWGKKRKIASLPSSPIVHNLKVKEVSQDNSPNVEKSKAKKAQLKKAVVKKTKVKKALATKPEVKKTDPKKIEVKKMVVKKPQLKEKKKNFEPAFYTVKTGDTFEKILEKLVPGVNPKELYVLFLRANPQIQNITSIGIGDKIYLPEDYEVTKVLQKRSRSIASVNTEVYKSYHLVVSTKLKEEIKYLSRTESLHYLDYLKEISYKTNKNEVLADLGYLQQLSSTLKHPELERSFIMLIQSALESKDLEKFKWDFQSFINAWENSR